MTAITRRDALVVALGSTSLLGAKVSDNSSGPQPRRLELCSPKDGVVTSVAAANGARVKAGDLLISIDSEDEHQTLIRLQLSKALLNLETKLLTDEQIKLRRRLVEIAVEIANRYVEYAEFKWQKETTQHKLGLVTDVIVKQDEAALGKARGEQEKAQLALATFDFNVQMMKERHALISAQLPSEENFVQQKAARLDIHSPLDGILDLRVANGSFIKLGHVFATIS